MKLLAIDTSTDIASVALKTGDEIIFEQQPSQKTHAQVLLPIIDGLLAQAQISLGQLDGIVFGCGPGSFTGLRIACSIAKGLAYAHDLGVIPVGSLGAIAYEVRQLEDYANQPILVVLDARMQELYWGYFPTGALLAEDNVHAPENILVPEGNQVVISGIGIDAYWDQFTHDVQAQVVRKHTCYPTAAAMIGLALEAGIKPVAPALAKPMYVRNKVTQGDPRG